MPAPSTIRLCVVDTGAQGAPVIAAPRKRTRAGHNSGAPKPRPEGNTCYVHCPAAGLLAPEALRASWGGDAAALVEHGGGAGGPRPATLGKLPWLKVGLGVRPHSGAGSLGS